MSGYPLHNFRKSSNEGAPRVGFTRGGLLMPKGLKLYGVGFGVRVVEFRLMNCPTCEMTIETEGFICPHCLAPIRGLSRGKHVKGTRDVLQGLKSERWRCVHGILRVHPCESCGRSELECVAYQHSTEHHVKQLLLNADVTKNPNEALAVAKLILDRERR